jgi:membrane fusion protein, heavy metal efflux system
MRSLFVLIFGVSLSLAQPGLAAESEHDHEEGGHNEGGQEEKGHEEGGHEEGGNDEGGHEEESPGSVELTPQAMRVAEIVVEALAPLKLRAEIRAPGEIKLNTYLSSKVSPRITAQVVERHASLGDVVVMGQALVTLSSVELAKTVGDLLVAEKEWSRVKRLGSKVISDKRLSEAQIAREQALAIVKAYGVSPSHLERIIKSGIDEAPGQFQMHASQDGVVVSDQFIIGELIEPGRVIFDIVNENVLWVESSLSPEIAGKISVGASARVRASGDAWLPAVVTQKHHMLDEETRTIGIRMEVRNDEDRLHAGTYVDTRIESQNDGTFLAVPTAAVLRSPDGDWMVFVEQKPGYFKPEEIEVVRIVDDYTVIEGIEKGTRIVTQGAFFVQSELAKSGFEVHNH